MKPTRTLILPGSPPPVVGDERRFWPILRAATTTGPTDPRLVYELASLTTPAVVVVALEAA